MVDPRSLEPLTARTLAHYERAARSFEEGTRAHDVSQNYAALLDALFEAPLDDTEGPGPYTILDFGCGPGRDLSYFASLGHEAVGLDGCARFVEMARAATQCEVLHQDFIALTLPRARFNGVFANASLFHVPTSALPQVLRTLHESLRERGVLFCSNPWGEDAEGFAGERYGVFHSRERWHEFVTAAGFRALSHYYRPTGRPRSEQPWLATVWRKG